VWALAQVSPDDPFLAAYELGWMLETPLLILSIVMLLIGFRRVFPLSLHPMFARQPNPGLGVTRATLLFAAFWSWWVLQTGAASDIVGYYTLLYASFALASLVWLGFRFPVLGVYHLADVMERGNLAAALALSGFGLGTAFAFGGALTGEGPGWWVVAVFFAAAYVELRGNMALVARMGGVDEEMRLERDASAGLLLGAVAMASGLVSGRAAAGDFHGWERDVPDYLRRLWPLVLVGLLGTGVGAFTRHSPRKLLLRGLASAALVAGGLAYYVLT
jgi:uncharacterized membrane protein YjfL (UPF0719 family)